MNPFEILGLPPKYDLDLDELGARQRKLSKALHPDRYAGSPASERRLALHQAINVNEAHRMLRDPVRRAEALLAELGQPTESQAGAPGPEFLMDIMERREALSEARRSADVGQLEVLSQANSEDERAVMAELGLAFRIALEEASAQDARATAGMSRIQSALAKLRYYQRFQEEAAAILDELV